MNRDDDKKKSYDIYMKYINATIKYWQTQPTQEESIPDHRCKECQCKPTCCIRIGCHTET